MTTYKQIGNITESMFNDISRIAVELGFHIFLDGRYRWDDYRSGGTEVIGSPPEHFLGGKELDGKTLPHRFWYDEEQDILAFSLSESYGQGQVSSVYFGR